MTESALILLAAGSSSRMGEAKQLMAFGKGRLIEHAMRQALASRCRPVVVVLGARSEQIREVLEGWPVLVAVNERWEEGMGTSIQCGLAALAESGVEGAILALADQPMVTGEVYDRLLARHEATGQPIVAAQYAGTVGVPVFFARRRWADLEGLAPGQGCKGVILANPGEVCRMDCPEAEMDLDTPADLERLAAIS